MESALATETASRTLNNSDHPEKEMWQPKLLQSVYNAGQDSFHTKNH
jgi:hypothetical protein